MQRRDRGIAQSLGGPLAKRVKDSRVLLVGAGGIGCEVLKNLVCCGFGSSSDPIGTNNASEAPLQPLPTQRKPEIVVVDLDTIDLSNLNRQFLFRKQHIKKPKAFVAKETASQFNPSVNIDAHHASIFDSRYTVEFFESFDMVFNALDNLAARRHVNRMCLAADVPLIESGTTGFNGQVQAIKKGVTECYDCNPKPVQKSFPICTIRSTPSQPTHCIVWAKSYLFPELFGTSEEDSADVAVTEGDNAEEVAKLKVEAEALKKIRSLMGKSEFAQKVFDKVFHEDIERLRSMSEMWQSRKPPESLKYDALRADIDAEIIKRGQSLSSLDQSAWSLQDNLAVFTYSLDVLSSRVQAGENVIEFDKDDKDTLDFVASAANLRSHIFAIPLHSEWDIKQMAGNIIPAIATSNALTAALCVLESFKVLRSQTQGEQRGLSKPTLNNHLPTTTGQQSLMNGKEEPILGGSKMVFLNSRSTDRMILAQNLVAPNKDCPVCSPVYAKLVLLSGSQDLPTLQELVSLLEEKIGYAEFSISTEKGIIYDPDLDENLPKALSELGVDGGSNQFITVMDDADEPKADLVLSLSQQPAPLDGAEELDGLGTALRLVPEKPDLPLKPKKAPEANGVNGEAETTSVLVDGGSLKRKREAESEVAESSKKRAKQDEVFVIEDDGAILLD